MPAHNAHGRVLLINGVDLSSRLIDGSLDIEYGEIDVTNQATIGNQEVIASITGYTFNCEIQQDYGIGSTHDTLIAAVNAGTVPVWFRSGIIAALGIEEFRGNFLPTAYTPIPAGSHTDLAKVSFSWPAVGTILRGPFAP